MNTDQIQRKPVKVAFIGTQRVGKTSIITKFHFGTFEKNTIATVGASFILHNFEINEKEIPFQIWDTAGQEKYRSLGPIYYRDASAAIAVFDLTTPPSFDALQEFIGHFKEHCPDYVHIAIVGNKEDLYEKMGGIEISRVRSWAENEGYSFHTTSALNGDGINDLFNEVAKIVAEKMKSPTEHVRVLEPKVNNDSCNC